MKVMNIIRRFVGIIEVGIGVTTLAGLGIASFVESYAKPPAVYLFVFFSACGSLILGIGMLRNRDWARILLVFFSGYVILTKLLIFAGLMAFRGKVFIWFPEPFKNGISVIYHAILILLLTSPAMRRGSGNA